MRNSLGLEGIVGVVVVVLGIALATYQDPVIGAALMLLLAGIALVAKGLIGSAMQQFGLK